MFKKIGYYLLAIILMVVMIGGMASGCASETKTIKLVYVQWSCAEAETHLAEVMLKDMGYDVEKSMVAAGIMWSAVASGDADAFTTAWLPYTHASYWDEYGDDVVKLGVLYEGAKIGLVVPDYVTIDSIAEMKDYADEFQSRIVGIDSGAGIMKATMEQTKPTYGLDDWELVESSEAAMMAELERSVNNNEWIAITGWAPHWMFFSYDLKFLEDPDETYGGSEQIVIIGREGFEEDFPDAAEFFANFKLTSAQLGEVMYMINVDGMDPSEAAQQWIDDNPDVVATWRTV
jgi:glycine betaine/proline transport system substrate-binding protein